MQSKIRNAALAVIAAALLLPSLAFSADDYAWKIRKDRWTESDERRYSEFVQALGESRCRNTDECLKSPANPFRGSDPQGAKWYSDCADLPFTLRAYFAWKNGLPFGFVSGVASVEGGRDIRYTPKGNRVTARTDITVRSVGQYPHFLKVLNGMQDTVSSAMFRFHPNSDSDTLFTDHYPVRLSRETIRPGTVIYDPNGHVAVVYKIENDGRALFMDAHPDNSITRGTYGKKFARSNPGMGAGFKNWRPIMLTGARPDANGILVGGRITSVRNASLADFSTEQFFGTQPSTDGRWQAGIFSRQRESVEYYDYVRQALAVGNLKYEPLEELRNMLDALCMDLHDRGAAVDLAIARGIHAKAHPERLPTNIYGTSGEWEDYSTPSRDARFKTSVKEMRDRVVDFVDLKDTESPKLDYQGTDLKADLLEVYLERTQACQLIYTKSDGSTRTLNLDEVIGRLFGLSFDPYHCIERRWGETDATELRSCRDERAKQRWYEGQQFLRNQIDRTYDARMDFSIEEIFTPRKGNGVESAPDVDVKAFLTN